MIPAPLPYVEWFAGPCEMLRFEESETVILMLHSHSDTPNKNAPWFRSRAMLPLIGGSLCATVSKIQQLSSS